MLSRSFGQTKFRLRNFQLEPLEHALADWHFTIVCNLCGQTNICGSESADFHSSQFFFEKKNLKPYLYSSDIKNTIVKRHLIGLLTRGGLIETYTIRIINIDCL